MRRKIAIWLFVVSLAFLGGSGVASWYLYRLAKGRLPALTFNTTVELPGQRFPMPACRIAAVEWYDATIFLHGEDLDYNQDWHNYLGHKISFGCVAVQSDILMVVNEFGDGKIGELTFIPSKWVFKIIWLKEVKDEKPSQTR